MELEFTKMHGLGNDFVVLNGLERTLRLTGEQIRFLADRHFGVGCDQVLLIESAGADEADIRYRIFNADGEEAQQCGNGARCIAEFLRREGIKDPYNLLKNLTRGHDISEDDLKKFIDELNIDKGLKDELKSLSVQDYIGEAKKITERVIKEAKAIIN